MPNYYATLQSVYLASQNINFQTAKLKALLTREQIHSLTALLNQSRCESDTALSEQTPAELTALIAKNPLVQQNIASSKETLHSFVNDPIGSFVWTSIILPYPSPEVTEAVTGLRTIIRAAAKEIPAFLTWEQDLYEIYLGPQIKGDDAKEDDDYEVVHNASHTTADNLIALTVARMRAIESKNRAMIERVINEKQPNFTAEQVSQLQLCLGDERATNYDVAVNRLHIDGSSVALTAIKEAITPLFHQYRLLTSWLSTRTLEFATYNAKFINYQVSYLRLSRGLGASMETIADTHKLTLGNVARETGNVAYAVMQFMWRQVPSSQTMFGSCAAPSIFRDPTTVTSTPAIDTKKTM